MLSNTSLFPYPQKETLLIFSPLKIVQRVFIMTVNHISTRGICFFFGVDECLKRENGKEFLIKLCAAIDFIARLCVCVCLYYTIESLTVLKKQ